MANPSNVNSGSPLLIGIDELRLKAEIRDGETWHFPERSTPEIWKKDGILGRGGFGEVWKETRIAPYGQNHAAVRAVKRIRKTDGRIRELLNLIKLSTSRYYGPDHLQHFVEFFGWFEYEDHIHISMEFIQHYDLQHHIQLRHDAKTGFHESEGARIVSEIAKALKFMHGKNIWHRDLKPANVLVYQPGPDWRVKLADFGISKDIELSSALTKAGTEGYMAPEVADTNRGKSYKNAIDIWSLGAITFCIHTGRPPFQDPLAFGRYIDGRGRFPLNLLMNFSGKLVIFILQLMDVDDAKRPTADEVLEHEWVKQKDDGQTPNREGSTGSSWNEGHSAEWPALSSTEQTEDSLSPEEPSRLDSPVNTSNKPAGLIRQELNPYHRVHNTTSDPIGTGKMGDSRILPPGMLSPQTDTAGYDSAPELRASADISRYPRIANPKILLSPAQPEHIQPPGRVPGQEPLKQNHKDSGYGSMSLTYQKTGHMEASNPVKPGEMVPESPQQHPVDPFPGNQHNKERNPIAEGFIGPLTAEQHEANCNRPGPSLSPDGHDLIDFGPPTSPPVTERLPEPLIPFGPWPMPPEPRHPPQWPPDELSSNPWR